MSNKSGVVYIKRDKFEIYSPMSGTILEFRYVPEIIKDLDVVNKSLLEEIVKLFIDRAQIPSGNLLFVIADDASFIKDFTAESPNDKNFAQEKAREFIEHAPFDNVSSKIFSIPGGARAFITNKDLFKAIKSAFEKHGFKVEAVLPGFLVGNGMGTQPSLTPQMANYALLKANTLRQYNLLTETKAVESMDDGQHKSEEKENYSVPEEEKNPSLPDKKRLRLLLSVFIGLILFTVVFYFVMYPPTPHTPSVSATKTVPPPQSVKGESTTSARLREPIAPTASSDGSTIEPTIEPTVEPSLSQPDGIDSFTIQIISGTNNVSSAETVKKQLAADGFTSIALRAQNQGISQSIVTFAPTVNQTVRDMVLKEVYSTNDQVFVQEKEGWPNDITILLGN